MPSDDLYLPASPRPKPDEQIMTWQPIETAPKDGSWVLIAGGFADEDRTFTDDPPKPFSVRPVTAFFDPNAVIDDGDEATTGVWKYAHWDGAWYSQYLNPTHWMPLPSPPAETDPNPTA